MYICHKIWTYVSLRVTCDVHICWSRYDSVVSRSNLTVCHTIKATNVTVCEVMSFFYEQLTDFVLKLMNFVFQMTDFGPGGGGQHGGMLGGYARHARRIRRLSRQIGLRCVTIMKFVFKNEEFCIKNNECCIKTDEICIKNDECCIKNDEICIKNDEFCIKNDECCIKHDGFCR